MPIFYKGFGLGALNQQGFLVFFIHVHCTDKVLFEEGNDQCIWKTLSVFQVEVFNSDSSYIFPVVEMRNYK